MKECNKCKVRLIVGENIKLSIYKNYDYTCDICRNNRTRNWKTQNVEQVRVYNSNYRKANKQYYEDYDKNRYIKNKDIIQKYITKYQKERKSIDPLFKFTCNVRSMLGDSFRRSLKGKCKKPKKTEELLGCSIKFFIAYISSLFTEGMSLNNHGEWHLDHIIPISSAKTKEEAIKLSHYTNMQPLWKKDNLKKSNKILGD